jgi:hypothetical protein
VVDAHEPVRDEYLQVRDQCPHLAPDQRRPRIRPGECEPGQCSAVGVGRC